MARDCPSVYLGEWLAAGERLALSRRSLELWPEVVLYSKMVGIP